jgi:hypothetical protein
MKFFLEKQLAREGNRMAHPVGCCLLLWNVASKVAGKLSVSSAECLVRAGRVYEGGSKDAYIHPRFELC